VLARGLAKDPSARWETGTAMVAALRAALVAQAAPTVEATMALPPAVPVTATAEAADPVIAATPPVSRRFRRRLLIGSVAGLLVLVVGLVLLALATRAHPAVTLSAATVEQGGVVTARFDGFKAGQAVDITVAGTGLKQATIRADTQGRVVYAFNVPRTFATGPHELRGCAAAACAQAAFTVTLRRGG